MSERRPPIAQLVGTALLVLGGVAAYTIVHLGSHVGSAATATPRIAPAELVPLDRAVVDGQPSLVHPTLHFHLADPGPEFTVSPPELRGDAAMWFLRDVPGHRSVIVSLIALPPLTMDAFDAQVEGTRARLLQTGATIDSVTPAYGSGRSVCDIEFTLHDKPGVTRLDTFQIAGESPRRELVIAILGSRAMRDVVRSFVPP